MSFIDFFLVCETIVVFAWLVLLTAWAMKVPKKIDENCAGTAKAISITISDWFRNHIANYKHEPAEVAELIPPVDREKIARKMLQATLDINPKTGRPYKTPKNVREAVARYRNKKRGRK